MLTQDVRDLTSRSKKIRADDECLRKMTVELAGRVRVRDAHTMVEFACSKAITKKLAGFKSMLVASHAEGANSR